MDFDVGFKQRISKSQECLVRDRFEGCIQWIRIEGSRYWGIRNYGLLTFELLFSFRRELFE